MDVQQVADICTLVYFSFDMISHQLHEAWQPQLEHLIAPIAALHFYIGLQQRLQSLLRQTHTTPLWLLHDQWPLHLNDGL